MPGTAPSSPLLLSEHAKSVNSKAAMKFAHSIFTGGDSILKHLKFRTDSKLSMMSQQVRNSNLGTVNYGQLDEQPAETRSDSTIISRSVYYTSNMIAVDRRLLKSWNDGNVAGPNPIDREFENYAVNLKSDVGYRFFVNNQVTGEQDFEQGLWNQLQPSAVHADLHSSDVLVNGASVDITYSSGALAGAVRVVELIDQLKYQLTTTGGKADFVLAMAPLTKRRLRALFTSGRLFDVRKDQFGNDITSLNGIDIIETGVLASDGSTEVISTVETAAGTALTGSTFTSIYLVNRAAIDVWQPNVMKPEKLPDNGNFHEWLLNWGMGYIPLNDRPYGRIYGVEVTG